MIECRTLLLVACGQVDCERCGYGKAATDFLLNICRKVFVFALAGLGRLAVQRESEPALSSEKYLNAIKPTAFLTSNLPLTPAI